MFPGLVLICMMLFVSICLANIADYIYFLLDYIWLWMWNGSSKTPTSADKLDLPTALPRWSIFIYIFMWSWILLLFYLTWFSFNLRSEETGSIECPRLSREEQGLSRPFVLRWIILTPILSSCYGYLKMEESPSDLFAFFFSESQATALF